jgi:hypothetical protein
MIWDSRADYLFRVALSFRIAATLFVRDRELTRRVLDFVKLAESLQAWKV